NVMKWDAEKVSSSESKRMQKVFFMNGPPKIRISKEKWNEKGEKTAGIPWGYGAASGKNQEV
ncbi:MAG: hypothetical protein J6A23_00435, partial [Thermoguttaceae bacterium]|nr:hypothetical protein [Thermoguttaceae bacterium]